MKTYLDYNATAPIRPEVIELMSAAMTAAHNASAVHSFGREGRSLIENAREQIAALIGTPPAQAIFNSGATEGNNTVLQYFAREYAGEQILVSAIEHPAVLEATPNLKLIPVTRDGVLDLNALEALLKDAKTSLVSVMMVNNETGIIQPVKDAAALAHKHGALFHCDAVQAAGRIRISMQETGIDFLTLSAHKMGGPQGVGVLALGICGVTPTLLHGGGQEKSARAGTENVSGIAGFGLAAQIAANELDAYQTKTKALQETLETALSGLKIFGQNAARVTNTTLFTLPGASSETLLMSLDLDGVAVSNGSACSSGRVQASHVLKAMGAGHEEASGAIRISTGWNTTPEDIEAFLKSWNKTYERLKDKRSA